ncbi:MULTISPECIES: hypothetical protein [Rothia]|nr:MULTISPECIES: hypothetical protein [Rothia]
MSQDLTVPVYPLTSDEILVHLDQEGIGYNDFLPMYLTHSKCLPFTEIGNLTVRIATLAEFGFTRPVEFPELLKGIESQGYSACPPTTGFYLRMMLSDQNQSTDSVLSAGRTPQGAINVLTQKFTEEFEVPRMLYLRNVDGKLWLRASRFTDDYEHPLDSVFAVLVATKF